jgi:hypothetical protein
MRPCDHDFETTWRCSHTWVSHQDGCALGYYTYTCKLCKEPGFALLDGVNPTTVIYGEYSATRQQEVRDQIGTA